MSPQPRHSESGPVIDWPAVWHAAEQLDNEGNDDGANAVRAMHAEITRLYALVVRTAEALDNCGQATWGSELRTDLLKGGA